MVLTEGQDGKGQVPGQNLPWGRVKVSEEGRRRNGLGERLGQIGGELIEELFGSRNIDYLGSGLA